MPESAKIVDAYVDSDDKFLDPTILDKSLIERVSKDKNLTELEFGDFLFSVVNYARFLDIDPEIALEKSNKKFTKRFEKIEHEARKKGLSLGEVNINDLNLLWENAKK